jgi:hypothetical protein
MILREEIDLKKPCWFEICIDGESIMFCCSSSMDYLEWIGCLRMAKGIKDSLVDRSINDEDR